MANSSRRLTSLIVIAHAVLLFSHTARCDHEEEGDLLQGINSFRTSMKLPALAKHDRAGCLADEIADELEDRPCTNATTALGAVGAQTRLTNYPNALDKCNVDINTTTDGVVMPVCVPKLVSTLVLTNYTHSPYARFLNDSRYTGAGLGSDDNWMVVILTTSSPAGSFASAAFSMYPSFTWVGGACLMTSLLGLVLVGWH